MRLKRNKDRANEEFVRRWRNELDGRLVQVIQSFPELNDSPLLPRYCRYHVGAGRVKKALGAVGWAARWARTHGPGLAYHTRKAETPAIIRKRTVARLSSVVHQIDDELRFLNDMRNVLRNSPT